MWYNKYNRKYVINITIYSALILIKNILYTFLQHVRQTMSLLCAKHLWVADCSPSPVRVGVVGVGWRLFWLICLSWCLVQVGSRLTALTIQAQKAKGSEGNTHPSGTHAGVFQQSSFFSFARFSAFGLCARVCLCARACHTRFSLFFLSWATTQNFPCLNDIFY